MSEVYVIDIATGDASQNKTAVVLNRAGDSPHNPILRGLGMSLDVKLSPDVLAFETVLGMATPPDDKIIPFTQIDTNHFRHRGRAGYDSLGLNTVYSEAVRHFLRVDTQAVNRVYATEREFWIQETPTVTAYFCGATLGWCEDAAGFYFGGSTIEDPPFGLTNDPGTPPTTSFSRQSPNAETAQIQLGPDRVVEFLAFSEGTIYPLEIPITIMDAWRDEFNQKHFGGAKYVSVFEEGLAEDAQGSFITNRYQEAIASVDSMTILTHDPTHEYRVVFRFRSELDDPYYVDFLVRFRIANRDDLNRVYAGNIYLEDFPDIVFDEGSGDYFWDGFPAFDAEFNPNSARLTVDTTEVTLPTDDVTAFPSNFADLRSLAYGGEVVVRFSIGTAFLSEMNYVTYRVTRPNGANALPVVIEKALHRRLSLTNDATFQPATVFRLIEPTLDPSLGGLAGPVYVEVINNQVKHKQVTLWTDKGSINLDVPLRNGMKYDITTIVDVASDGRVLQGEINALLMTENTMRVLQVQPQVVRPFFRAPILSPGTDFVRPAVTVNWPDLTITWPATSDQGDPYEIANEDVTVGAGTPGSRFYVHGRAGIEAVDNHVAGGGGTLVGFLPSVAYPTDATLRLIYSVVINGTDLVHYLLEVPNWAGYDDYPPSGYVPGDLQLILYDTMMVVAQLPVNFSSLTVTGNLGSKQYFQSNLIQNQWYDISSIYDGTGGQIDIEYETADLSVSPVVFTGHGPYTIPEFVPDSPLVPLADFSITPNVWNTSRLANGPYPLPQAKIDAVRQTIEFDFDGVFQYWLRWSAINPLDQTRLVFDETPPNRKECVISRLFRGERKYRLENGQSVVVVFLHSDGPHIVALYKISGDFESPMVLDYLRGQE